MTLSFVDNALWAASFIGQTALALVLLARGRAREFPVLTGFILFEAMRNVVVFFVSRHGSYHAYFLTYWITGFGDYALQLALIWEVARTVLRPTGTWVRDARKAFLGWGTVAVGAAALLSLQLGPPEAKGVDLWDARVTVFTSLLTCLLFIAVSAAANRLGLQQGSHILAILQGWFAWSFIALLEEFGHAILGWNREFVALVHIRMSVYLLVLIYWIWSMWLPEKARAPLSPEMNAYLLALHKRVQYDLNKLDGPPSI
jgi:hypothetical protein